MAGYYSNLYLRLHTPHTGPKRTRYKTPQCVCAACDTATLPGFLPTHQYYAYISTLLELSRIVIQIQCDKHLKIPLNKYHITFINVTYNISCMGTKPFALMRPPDLCPRNIHSTGRPVVAETKKLAVNIHSFLKLNQTCNLDICPFPAQAYTVPIISGFVSLATANSSHTPQWKKPVRLGR
jgi:hypothetical protein